MLSFTMLDRCWGQTSLGAGQVVFWAIFFWVGTINWLVKVCRGLWGPTIICGPESLEIILALRENNAGGYLAFAGLIVFYFHLLSMFNKKEIAAKFKQTLAFET